MTDIWPIAWPASWPGKAALKPAFSIVASLLGQQSNDSLLGKSISKRLPVGQFEIADLAMWTLVESADMADNDTPRIKLRIVD